MSLASDASMATIFAQSVEDIALDPLPKRQRLSPRNRMPLNTARDIFRETTRVYRLALNGKIPLDAATKLVFMLREARCGVEAVDEAEAAARAQIVDSEPPVCVTSINITSIPSGEFSMPREDCQLIDALHRADAIDRAWALTGETPPAPHLSTGFADADTGEPLDATTLTPIAPTPPRAIVTNGVKLLAAPRRWVEDDGGVTFIGMRKAKRPLDTG
jgi:hypothetical protein